MLITNNANVYILLQKSWLTCIDIYICRVHYIQETHLRIRSLIQHLKVVKRSYSKISLQIKVNCWELEALHNLPNSFLPCVRFFSWKGTAQNHYSFLRCDCISGSWIIVFPFFYFLNFWTVFFFLKGMETVSKIA